MIALTLSKMVVKKPQKYPKFISQLLPIPRVVHDWTLQEGMSLMGVDMPWALLPTVELLYQTYHWPLLLSHHSTRSLTFEIDRCRPDNSKINSEIVQALCHQQGACDHISEI